MRELYFNLFKDIIDNYSQIIKGINFMHLKKASFPDENQNLDRYFNFKSLRSKEIAYFDPRMTSHIARIELNKRESTRKIFDYIIENNLSPFEVVPFEEDIRREPSVTKNLIADFVRRMSELSKFGLDFTKETFDKTYKELEDFLYSDKFKYKVLVNLYGPLGEVENISIENATIKKADYEMSKLFCFHHSDSLGIMDYEMIEGDYYFEIEREINKNNWREELRAEKDIIEKVFNNIVLSCSGNIERGKFIKVSNAWPLIKTERIDYNNTTNKYGEKNKFRYIIDDKVKNRLFDNYSILKGVDYDKLDSGIKASINRLKKSKSTQDIEDKIIELVLSIEYLINTATYEVTLQLCLKIIKMYNQPNHDDSLFKLLKDFFNLRGNVVHGNKKVEASEKNVGIIQKVEEITLHILVKFIHLNQKFSFKQINKAIEKSLYIDKSIEDILKDKSA